MLKVALVTGASRGIGRATAILLAKNGYRVCVNFNKSADEATGVVKQILDFGGHAIPIRADVADEKQIIRMFESIDHEFGHLDVLVNNAGILFTQCSISQLDSERINKIFSTNVTGTIICSREAVKRMSTLAGGSGGVIVNLSSRAAIWGSPMNILIMLLQKVLLILLPLA
nr:SDR family NAD(P)-dependent oxidoreductase [Aquella oligotrophica]